MPEDFDDSVVIEVKRNFGDLKPGRHQATEYQQYLRTFLKVVLIVERNEFAWSFAEGKEREAWTDVKRAEYIRSTDAHS